jgi:signal transduction histidine kinase
MLLMSVPEAVLTGNLISAAASFIGNITAFCILVGSRIVANRAWDGEKRAQHAEALAHRKQAETMKLQLDFISAVSHELRNPVATFLLTTEHLVSTQVEPEIAAKHHLLFRESKRLSKRVEGLLTFGRMLGSATVDYRRECLDPVELVEEVVREFQSANSGPQSELLVSVEDNTPLIEGDAAALSTAVWNLLENAVKYSPDCHKVWIELGSEDHSAYIRVRDQGRGIAERDIPRVFDKYFRGESAHHTNGSGIGLALVRLIVEAHRGAIHLESRVGQGSSFTLVLPGARINPTL